jgi:hypothetical protein
MIPIKTNFVPGETKKVARSVTIAGNMVIIFPMIVRSLQDTTRIMKMMAINTSTRRKTMRKVTTRSKKREQIKAFLGEWITDSENSSDDSSDDDSKKKIAGIAINDNEPPLPPPPNVSHVKR